VRSSERGFLTGRRGRSCRKSAGSEALLKRVIHRTLAALVEHGVPRPWRNDEQALDVSGGLTVMTCGTFSDMRIPFGYGDKDGVVHVSCRPVTHPERLGKTARELGLPACTATIVTPRRVTGR
jgi:hypothetical protein